MGSRRAVIIAASCLVIAAAGAGAGAELSQVTGPFDALSLAPRRPCPGDCDGDGAVTIAELMAGIGMALGSASSDACRMTYCDGGCGPGPGVPPLTVACLVRAVRSALDGCDADACAIDADCDDANACSSDRCVSGVCTHECLCV